MKGINFFIQVFAIIKIGAGFLSVMEVVAGELPKAPSLKVLRVAVGLHGDKKAEDLGVVATYDVDPENGCIQNFYNRKGEQINSETQTPGWLVEGKNILYSGSFSDLQCRQGIIDIGGSPTEYWAEANRSYFCIGAWDPECGPFGHWYQTCQNRYTCPHQ